MRYAALLRANLWGVSGNGGRWGHDSGDGQMCRIRPSIRSNTRLRSVKASSMSTWVESGLATNEKVFFCLPCSDSLDPWYLIHPHFKNCSWPHLGKFRLPVRPGPFVSVALGNLKVFLEAPYHQELLELLWTLDKRIKLPSVVGGDHELTSATCETQLEPWHFERQKNVLKYRQ